MHQQARRLRSVNIFPQEFVPEFAKVLDTELAPVVISTMDTLQTLADGDGSFFSPDERALLDRISSEKRKNEFISGRISAKMAVGDFIGADERTYKQISIVNTKSGRPEARCRDAACCSFDGKLSISHSGGYGCALAAGQHCGIDIQKKSATLERVKSRYCFEQELNILAASLPVQDRMQQLCLLWTAKEAVKKSLDHLQMPGFMNIVLRKCRPLMESYAVLHFAISRLSLKTTVISGFISGYGLSITTIKTDKDEICLNYQK
ncbi:MAG: hypothetical protein CSB24_01305 [Deltaproteobacteria bacterium]|nr:MAG: hypothetical protein CSB24_01305 [Deltaproteobacteria bacterium]